MALVKLVKKGAGYFCPTCGRMLHHVSGGVVEIVNGRVNMEATQPKYECAKCGVYYRELLGSGFFEDHPMDPPPPPSAPKTKKRLLRTGDIPPMILTREADGKCPCPRCGERMDFVEGQPVRIVDGKADMENVMDHFRCPYCHSVFRRIVGTDYFQWSAK